MRFFSAFFTFTGILFVFGGVFELVGSAWFGFKAQQAVGEVISVEKRYLSSGNDGSNFSFRPTVRYQDSMGKTFASAVYASSSEFDFEPGTRVDVLYDPANPEDVRIRDLWSLYVSPVSYTLVGLLCLVVGVFLYPSRVSRRKPNRSARDETA
ncbi:MAG: DUF3592 domain-containing protein [Pseudomonadota bacterium]